MQDAVNVEGVAGTAHRRSHADYARGRDSTADGFGLPAIWLWVRTEWRRRLASLVGLALLIGGAGGTTLAAWAGARRTDTAFERRVEREHAVNIDVLNFPPLDGPGPEMLERIAAIPGVTGALSMDFAFVRLDDSRLEFFSPIPTAEIGPELWRPEIVRGRRLDPEVASEVVINEEMAEMLAVDVGDRRMLETINAPSLNRVRFDPGVTTLGPTIPVTIVGIFRSAEDVADRPEPTVIASAALLRDYGSQITHCRCRIGVRADPARIDDVMAELRTIFPEGATIERFDTFAARIGNAIGVQTAALYVFMATALLAGLVVVTQAMMRHAAAQLDESATRAALGMTNEQLLAGGLIGVVPAIAAGLVIAVAVAIAASPLLPIGVAGRAEPDPGLRIDALVLVLGGAALVVVTAATAVATTWWLRRSRPSQLHRAARRVPRPAVWAAALGPAARVGIGMTIDRRRGAMAARSAMVGVGVAVAGVLGAVGFVHAIDHVFAQPRVYGAGFDALISGVPGQDYLPDSDTATSLEMLTADPAIEAVAVLEFPSFGDNVISGPSGTRALLDPTAFENHKGSIPLTMLDGRAPTSDDELVMGTRSRAAVGAKVGDYVEVIAGPNHLQYQVVGTVLFPDVDQVDYAVVATGDGLKRLEDATGVPNDVEGIVVRFAPGANKSAEIERLRATFPTIEPPRKPSSVHNLDEIGPLPYYLAAFLGALGTAATIHALVMTARRRRRDLAVCRAIGFVPRQVMGALGAHALASTIVGLAVGLPVGFAIGRQVFSLVAQRAHILTVFPLPVVAALCVVPATLLATLLIALVPAGLAARVRPAEILRAE